MGYLAAKAKHRASGVSSSTPLRRDRYCTQVPDTGRYQQGYISALLVLEADWDFLILRILGVSDILSIMDSFIDRLLLLGVRQSSKVYWNNHGRQKLFKEAYNILPSATGRLQILNRQLES